MTAKKKDLASADYEVGYGRPPARSRFQPGRSGNTSGRKRGAATRDANLVILDEAYRLVPVREGNRTTKMPLLQALMRSLGMQAAKGNSSAQRLLLNAIRSAEDQQHASLRELLDTAATFKENARRIQEQYAKEGCAPPREAPHPDDVHVNPRTAEVTFFHPDFSKPAPTSRPCEAT